MFKRLVASTILFSSAISIHAAVLIGAPEEITIVAINDQQVSDGFIGNSKTYKLDAGQHKISVQYKQIFNPDYIRHEVVRSGVITLTTNALADGQTYQLALVNPPKDLDEGKAFAKQPTIALQDAQGQIVAQQTGSSQSKSWLLGGLFGGSTVTDVSTSTSSNTIKPLPVTAQATQNVTASSNIAPITSSASSIATGKDQQLIELWKSATPQERQKFLSWFAEQSTK